MTTHKWTDDQQKDLDKIIRKATADATAAAKAVPSSNVTYSSKLHIPSYDGTDVTPFVVARFTNQWEAYVASTKITDNQQLISAFQDCLAGPAKFWTSQYLTTIWTRTARYPTFTALFDKFKERFVPDLSPAIASDLLFVTKQLSSEVVTTYIDRSATELDAYIAVVKQQVGWKHFLRDDVRTKFGETMEIVCIHAILRGMHKDIREEIMRIEATINTFEMLSMHARKAMLTLNAQPAKAAPTSSSVLADINELDTEQVEDEISARLAEIDFLQTRRRANTRAPIDVSKIRCHNCKKMGHFASRCQAPPASSSSFRFSGPPKGNPFPQRQSAQRRPVYEIAEIEAQMNELRKENAELTQNLHDWQAYQNQTETEEPQTNDINALDFGVENYPSDKPEQLYAQDFQ